MIKQIGKYTIELKEKLTYGEKSDIEAVFLGGVKGVGGEFDTSVMWKAKIQTLKTYILSIKEGEKEVVFSEEWLRGLDADEGDELVEAVNGLKDKKKVLNT